MLAGRWPAQAGRIAARDTPGDIFLPSRVRRPPRQACPRRPLHHPGAVGQRRGGPVPDRGRHAAPGSAAHPDQKGSTMNDITRKRAQRVIEREVADGSMICLGDGRIIARDRRAQQTASQAVIMTSTTGYGAHLIALWSAAPAGTASLVLLIAIPSTSVAGRPLSRAHRPPWLLPPCGCVRPTEEANVPTPHRRRIAPGWPGAGPFGEAGGLSFGPTRLASTGGGTDRRPVHRPGASTGATGRPRRDADPRTSPAPDETGATSHLVA